MAKRFMYAILFMFTVFNLNESNLVEIVYPSEYNSSEIVESTAYEFVPISTMIGFGFIGVCFLTLTVAKIMLTSSDKYMMSNRYDLIIFKPPDKKAQTGGPRRVYSNNQASQHNLNAAAATGIDLSILNGRGPLNQFGGAASANANANVALPQSAFSNGSTKGVIPPLSS